MAKLLISLPTGDVSHELTGDVITIGRTPDNKIQINHHSVSAHHARLQLFNGVYKLKDLDSTNRSYVNNIPVNEAELMNSCFVRFGSIECVFKTEATGGNDQLQSQLTELQKQMENLMKARDQISQQNRALAKERDDAKQATEVATENLADAKRRIEELSSQSSEPQLKLVELSSKVAELQKQLESITRERDSLLESNKELKTRLEIITAKLDSAPKTKTGPVLTEAQKKATTKVQEAMDESVEDEEEEVAAAVPEQRTVAASVTGTSVRRIITGQPLLSSWVNRGTKPKTADDASAKPSNITAMPLQTDKPRALLSSPLLPPPPAPASAPATIAAPTLPAPVPAPAAPAPVPAPAPAAAPSPAPSSKASSGPVLRIIPPASTNGHGASPVASGVRHKAAAAAAIANAAPQNPEIKPAWDLLNVMRRSLHYFLRHQDELKVLQEMEQNAHGLTEMARGPLLRPILELSTAVEALIRDLHTSPKNINASTLRTVGQSIDFLATLIDESNLSRIKDVSNAKVFAVDDDQGILDTITATMEMAHLNIITTGQPTEGLATLSEQDFDLILLDVGLPEMNGMDMCSRIRAMMNHQKTPIVFLTGEATVQNRVQSTLNGGNDLIGKPFSVLELSVKVLTWIFKGQLGLV